MDELLRRDDYELVAVELKLENRSVQLRQMATMSKTEVEKLGSNKSDFVPQAEEPLSSIKIRQVAYRAFSAIIKFCFLRFDVPNGQCFGGCAMGSAVSIVPNDPRAN